MKEIEPNVSIIIPTQEITDYLRQAISCSLKLNYSNFEILVLPDNETSICFENTKIISTGKISPAEKRNLALKYAKGEILAFLDSDVYPHADWLKNAVEYFKDMDIAGVCGPGITPPEDSLLQKVSGWIGASLLGGGPLTYYRSYPARKRKVKDYASMNLIIRRNDFESINGFNSHFWPGEDTELCLSLTKKLGKDIIYDPKVLVYHHRRALFIPHLKQYGRYGFRRGHFARTLPETSRTFFNFVPCCFILFLFLFPILISVFHFFFPVLASLFWHLYAGVNIFYFLLLLFTAVWVYTKERSIAIALLVIPGIVSTHIWYGLCFLQGLFFKQKPIQ